MHGDNNMARLDEKCNELRLRDAELIAAMGTEHEDQKARELLRCVMEAEAIMEQIEQEGVRHNPYRPEDEFWGPML